jgi:hypothetical protein
MIEGMDFQLGQLGSSGRVYVTTLIEEWREADIPHTGLIIYEEDAIVDHDIFPAEITSLLELQINGEAVMAALAIDGTLYLRRLSGDMETGHIDTALGGPSDDRHMSTMRIIGNQIYACGMGRIVYSANVWELKWERLDENIRIPFGIYEIAGFRDITGRGADDLFACGLAGELWHFDGTRWTREQLPTNVNLTSAAVRTNGEILIGGSRGTIFAGDHNSWRLLDWDDAKGRVTSIACCEEQSFAATQEGKLFLIGVDEVKGVNLSAMPIAGRRIERIVATGGRALGLGPESVALYEGGSWRILL